MTSPPPSPPPKPTRRGLSRGKIVAIVVAVLLIPVLLGAIVGLLVALRLFDSPATSAPAPPTTPDVATLQPPVAQASPTVTQATPPPPPPASPTATAEPLAGDPLDLSEIAAQVAEIRGLPLDAPIAARRVTPEALAGLVRDLAFAEVDAQALEADRRLLVALRLIPAELDLDGLLRELYAEQVLGLYVPEHGTLYVATDATELTPFERVTAAHEVVHALQDRTADLEALTDRFTPPDDAPPDALVRSDAQFAVLALVEGDAVAHQDAWLARHLSPDEQRVAASEGQASAGAQGQVLARTPEVITDSLFFPYIDGAAFAAAVLDAGGTAALDAALVNPPTTTEQILHPERYLAGEAATPIAVAGAPAEDWQLQSAEELGEFDLRAIFDVLGEQIAVATGDGWGGGEIRSWHREDEVVVGAAMTFDTDADAAEACAAVPQWYAAAGGGGAPQPVGPVTVLQGEGDVLAYRCGASEVRWALAPDEGSATAVAG